MQLVALHPGTDPAVEVGPVISPAAKARVEALVQSGVDEGARLLLDGRGVVPPPGYEAGNFVGPTVMVGPLYKLNPVDR
jgi:malonate-semialdehyde dehydrogenase (acetylating)/methylmalonate-semialdehyde dehydrogenase